MFYFLWSYTAEIRDRENVPVPGNSSSAFGLIAVDKGITDRRLLRRFVLLIFDARRAPHRCHRDVLFFHLRHIIRRFHHPIGRRSSGQNDFKPLPVPLYENAQPFSADHLSLRGGNNFVQYEEVRLLQIRLRESFFQKIGTLFRFLFQLTLVHLKVDFSRKSPAAQSPAESAGNSRSRRTAFLSETGRKSPAFRCRRSQSQSGGRRHLAFSVAVATDESYQCSLIPRRATKSIQSCSIAHSFRLSQLAVKKPDICRLRRSEIAFDRSDIFRRNTICVIFLPSMSPRSRISGCGTSHTDDIFRRISRFQAHSDVSSSGGKNRHHSVSESAVSS